MKICPTCKSEFASGEVFCPNDATRLSSRSQMPGAKDPLDPLIETTLQGRYRIIRRIGEGGMGLVYEAEHMLIEKRVAVKVLRDDFSSRPEVVERFRQEAKSASRIGHANIVDISDFGETPTGQSYFVMEMLDGEDLANVLARERTIEIKRACEIALQCCRALGAAHTKGIVHRDMKPENIFLTKRDDGGTDFVKLVDFGIAKMSDIETAGAPGRKLTKTGMIFGTPEYMSPEQAAGKSLDHRVDVYALGVILYEMLTGRVPFVGDTFMGILTQHMFEPPPPMHELNPNVSCSEALEEVIYKALTKNPLERYGSMEELARAIGNAMDLSIGFTRSEATYSGYGEPVKAVKRSPRLVEPAVTEEMSAISSSGAPTSRTPLMAAGFAALLVGAGVAGYVAFGSTDEDVRTVDPRTLTNLSEDASAAREPDASASTDVAAPPIDAQVAAADAAGGDDNNVRLEVWTDPQGAEVSIDGRVVCSPTPCSFDTPRGRQIRVTAKMEGYEGTETFVPVRPDTVSVVVHRVRRPARDAGTGRPPGPGGNNGDPHPNDLKQMPFHLRGGG